MATLTREQVAGAAQLANAWTHDDKRAFVVPNMDQLDESDLLALQRVFGVLGDYAQCKREQRLAETRYDDIASAECSHHCRTFWKLLPTWAKW